jgi:hypothetical protein
LWGTVWHSENAIDAIAMRMFRRRRTLGGRIDAMNAIAMRSPRLLAVAWQDRRPALPITDGGVGRRCQEVPLKDTAFLDFTCAALHAESARAARIFWSCCVSY